MRPFTVTNTIPGISDDNNFRELQDVRGGRVIAAPGGNYTNNLHVPNRGGDTPATQSGMYREANGQHMQYLWPLPYKNNDSFDLALTRALRLAENAKKPLGGKTVDQYFIGLDVGNFNGAGVGNG